MEIHLSQNKMYRCFTNIIKHILTAVSKSLFEINDNSTELVDSSQEAQLELWLWFSTGFVEISGGLFLGWGGGQGVWYK